MAKEDKDSGKPFAPTIHNRKARHNYVVLETYETGVELKGTEVKSIRRGEVSLDEAFARVLDGEVFLIGCHIKPYEHADPRRQPDPTRNRKLLLHKREIQALIGATAQKGTTLAPLKMYFKNGRVKLLIGLVRGRQNYDKRDKLKQQQHNRDIEQAMRRRR